MCNMAIAFELAYFKLLHYVFGHLISNLISRVVLAEADCMWLLLGLVVSARKFQQMLRVLIIRNTV